MSTTFRKRPTPRSVLRARHRITGLSPLGDIGVTLAALFAMPASQQDAMFARVAEQLRPEREALDAEARLAMLDVDLPAVAPRPRIKPSLAEVQSRFNQPSAATIWNRLCQRCEYMTNVPHRNVVAGLCVAYNSVLATGPDETPSDPWVFLPGSLSVPSDVPFWIEHRKELFVVRASDTFALFDNDPRTGVWVTLTLPLHNALADMVAGYADRGGLGLSIGYDIDHEEHVGGVYEIHSARVREISFTRSPREELAILRLAHRSQWLHSFDSWPT